MTVKVIPSVTTQSSSGSTWRDKLKELSQYRIHEVGLFLTGLSREERQECFALLLKIYRRQQLTIPFVHAVADMDETEFNFLRLVFKTQWFNLHPENEYPLCHPLGLKERSRILIENASSAEPLVENDINNFAGLCIDLSHLEEARLHKPDCFSGNLACCRVYPVVANHVSGVTVLSSTELFESSRSIHTIQSPAELSYLCGIPAVAIGSIAAIELENPLEEQLDMVPLVTSYLTQALKEKATGSEMTFH